MKLLTHLARMFRSWAGATIVVLLLVQTVVVALRYVFAMGWPWMPDLLIYLFYFSVLLPALMVLIADETVRVDVFYANWNPRRRRIIDRIALLFLFFPAMAYAAWASFGSTLNSWRVLEASPTFGGLPGYFLLKTALTLSFMLLAVAALVMALRKTPFEKLTGEVTK